MRVVERAREAARRSGCDYVGTEHLLLGVLGDEEGIAAGVLREIGVDVARVESEVGKVVRTGRAAAPTRQLPFTPRAKSALEASVEEAARLRHDRVDAGHLLLALLREREGIAVRVLRALGVDPEGVRRGILEALAN